MKLRCRLGFHKWKQSRELGVVDIFPPVFREDWQAAERTCIHCDKLRRWIPCRVGA